MDRLLSCACGEKIVVSQAQAGQQVSCGSCGAVVQVPTLRGLSELPLALDTLLPKAGATTDTWSWRGPVMAACLAGVLGFGIFSAREFNFYRLTRTNMNAAIHIQAETEGVDEMSPDALLTLWDDYSKLSLGPKRPPAYKQYNDFSDKSFRAGSITAAVTALLAVIAAGMVWSAKKAKRGA